MARLADVLTDEVIEGLVDRVAMLLRMSDSHQQNIALTKEILRDELRTARLDIFSFRVEIRAEDLASAERLFDETFTGLIGGHLDIRVTPPEGPN